ncbi:MAG: hypothetical protein GF330_14075 [Candidatus Eisenbacteria bacterium]|nr:hypothetical protein [Candidatus Eisenbacteria bacterium]
MMQRILRVAQREYLAYVRTKAFILSVVILPVILVLAFGLPTLMESMPKPPREFTLVDYTGRDEGELLAHLRDELSGPTGVIQIEMRDYLAVPAAQLDLPAGQEAELQALREMVVEGDLFAYFVLDSPDGAALPSVTYYTIDATADEVRGAVRRVLGRKIAIESLRPYVEDEALLGAVIDGVAVRTVPISKDEREMGMAGHVARSLAPMLFVYLLWISIMSMASHLMTSTIEEKSSRIIEVILSSTSPLEFMTGKLIGLAGAGLTTIAAWVAAAGIISSLMPSGTVVEVLSGLGSAFTPWTILAFLVFFLLGFLFYSSVYVGLGSVCNTMREAQSLLQPIMIVFIIPLFLMWYVTNNPDHIVAVVGSFIPPFTPFLMMNRIPANPAPPLWQTLSAAAVMVLATWGTIAASAKIFRIGILMYGKPPTLPEVLRWARQKG